MKSSPEESSVQVTSKGLGNKTYLKQRNKVIVQQDKGLELINSQINKSGFKSLYELQVRKMK